MESSSKTESVVRRAMGQKTVPPERFMEIVSRSKLTQGQADKLAKEINRGMAKRYRNFLADK